MKLPATMLFVCLIFWTAMRYGLTVSMIVSVCCAMVFSFFFAPPIYSFAVTHADDWWSIGIFLAAAILTSRLATRMKAQAAKAEKHRAGTEFLFRFSTLIVNVVGLSELLKVGTEQIAESLMAEVFLLLPDSAGKLNLAASSPGITVITEAESASATWVYHQNIPAGHGTEILSEAEWLYLPLTTPRKNVGVLGLRFHGGLGTQGRLLEALKDQMALAIERMQLAKSLEESRLMKQTERLETTLLSSISHDFRTPLAAIIGSATGLLSDKYDAAARRELLMTIYEEAQRLNRFVGNLLDMTRLESGTLELNRDWFELEDLIGTTISRLSERLSKHRFMVNLPPDLPLVYGDFVLLEHVLINLFDNAVKYSPEGSAIWVSGRRQNHDLIIEVRDEGIGVPQEERPLIFEKFRRSRSGNRQIAGIGLGLSICKGILEAHEGKIEADSPDGGVGILFRLTIPVKLPVKEMIPA